MALHLANKNTIMQISKIVETMNMHKFYKNFITAVKDYSSWVTILIIILMVASLTIAPSYAQNRAFNIKAFIRPLSTYGLMAFMSYAFLVLLTSIRDSPKLRWPYVFFSAFLSAFIGMYVMYWRRVLEHDHPRATYWPN